MTSYWPLITLLLLAEIVDSLLARSKADLAGTTMMAPWWWCRASLLAIAIAEIVITLNSAQQTPAWAGTARYMAAVGTFCPIMAVLGAKRPQDRGWQWVVLTQWIVLCVPAVHAVVTRTEATLQIHFAWKMLLIGLIVMQTINYLSARSIGTTLLVGLAQLVMLAPQLFGRFVTSTSYGIVGMILLVLAVKANSLEQRKIDEQQSGILLLWQRFRSLYGTFWTFRVMGLINQTSEAANWPVILLPDGFYHRSSQPDAKPATDLTPEMEQALHQALRNTLRRFLSEQELEHLPKETSI